MRSIIYLYFYKLYLLRLENSEKKKVILVNNNDSFNEKPEEASECEEYESNEVKEAKSSFDCELDFEES